MKLNRLETHDRLLHYKQEQQASIEAGLEECIKRNPLSVALQDKSSYIYIFAHPRTSEDGVTKRMLWQPRLTKPKAQTNSYLFRLQSKTDLVEIVWMLPPREMWSQYQKGNVTESDTVIWSIEQFMRHRAELEEPYRDDLSDEQASNIYVMIAREMDEEKLMSKLYVKPEILEASSAYQVVSGLGPNLDAFSR